MKTFLFILLSIPLFGLSQTDQKPNYNDSLITVKGVVKDTSYDVGFYNTVVMNKSIGKGIFGEYDGSFSISVQKKHKIGISVVGYQTIYISFKDSAYKPVYNVELFLQSLEYVGEEVIVHPQKTLEQLKEERAQIAKREVPVVTVENAIQSPITALYVAFSKREKTKRLVAEMEYKDKQADILREILKIYVNADILTLKDNEFEEFISFLNINTEFLKTATDYELITYIQGKYEHFAKIKEGF
ncbi:hypothetical protein K6119_02430 [Paracrocinitomix mangrovi]|uniref:hypothetical protein n=1 Tax=Paracrocinitomix mangrovi TaxID=2862509 RepID=UPI001C8D5E89|nr:hypothetical protein [Paracrocinitomix mangrovi]UKN02377.1 hypothetical protein K6119_02430 [Paracrocinitomix mangrovi]